MKRVLAFTLFFLWPLAFVSQAASSAPSPASANDPQLTLDEKIALVTDDIKRQDALEKAQKAFAEATKSLEDHQAATRKAIEDEHPGWTPERGQQGWELVKKPEPAATSAPAFKEKK